MRECDRLTIEEIGIPGIVLMETASRAVAVKAREMLGGVVIGKKVICLCGKGNNGGDGLAVARHLTGWGAEVFVYLLCKPDILTGDSALNYDNFLRVAGTLKVIESIEDVAQIDFNCDLIIDALLGTGFNPPANELYSQLIKVANESRMPILAVDIPSGVVGDNGLVGDQAIKAQGTVTFGLLKPGILLSPGRDFSGDVVVADIGIPPEVVARQKINLFRVEEDDVRAVLPRLKPDAHKGDAGFVYILAGSPGLTGSAALSAEAAMRAGAGLVTVGVPKSLNPILEIKLTEAMTEPLPETESGGLSQDAWEKVYGRLAWADAVVFGPGLGTDDATGELLALVLREINVPLVIDADGLNLLAKNQELLSRLPSKTILTPHLGEFSRLTGLTVKDISLRSIDLAREYSKLWNVVIHLKGAPSITAAPDGRVMINSTGNQGMATGGSGDVLTGIIAALLGGGVAPFEATWAGSYIHGLAGDLALETMGVRSMIAGDIISHLSTALRKLN